jgi:AraC family transcriptional regulator of adaptative response / DNA-3-methyladenine glycosylase II
MQPAWNIDHDAAYRAWIARDARFDGRLFVGVTSTGIYCRPVCRVRLPKQANCRFFPNAASAECEGFRPCLRCRPELAPGLSLMDSSQALADSAARRIEQSVHSGTAFSMNALAQRLGVTDRHLRRIFQAAHGVSPMDYLSTQRLLLAKQLLTDTALPVTQVALASGFASVRRFNDAFMQRYRMSPTRLRKEGDEPGAAREPVTVLRLGYRPPYDIEGMLAFLAKREVVGMESTEGLTVRRTMRIDLPDGQTQLGWIAATFVPERCEVWLAPSPSLSSCLGAVMHRVRQGLDLDADPSLIDPVLAALPMPLREGLRLPGSFDGFESAVRVLLGQQITVKAARTITHRLVERFGAPVESPFPTLHRAFPGPRTLAQADPADIGTLGIVRQRVKAIQALSQAVCEGRIELDRSAPLEPTLAALRELPGVGEWSAQVIAMRVLAWPDAFPSTDIGVLNALQLRDARAAADQSLAWRPWRAYAVMRLWHSLETAA